MKFRNVVRKYGPTVVQVAVPGALMVSGIAHAELPASVDTAISAAQADILEMIGKGFGIAGVVGGLWVAYKYFRRVLRGQ
jgi:hypothetical protein